MSRQGEWEPLIDEGRLKQDARAERILDATLELLQRWGYRKTTLDDIARQAGLTKGTIYQRWKTREELFEALLRREYLSIMLDLRQRIADDPTGVMLSALTRHLVHAVISHPLLKAVMQRDMEMLGDLLRTETGQRLVPARLASSQVYLEQLRAQGLLRTNISIDVQTKMLAAIYSGFFLVDQSMPSELIFSPAELVEGLVETIRRTFEPEVLPAPEVIEESTRSFVQLLDKFISVITSTFQEQQP